MSYRAYFHHVAARWWQDAEDAERSAQDDLLALLYDERSPTLRRWGTRRHLEAGRFDQAVVEARGLAEPLLRARLWLHRDTNRALQAVERGVRTGPWRIQDALPVLSAQVEAGHRPMAERLARSLLQHLPASSVPVLARWAEAHQHWELAAQAWCQAAAKWSPRARSLRAPGLPSRTGVADPVWPWLMALHRLGEAPKAQAQVDAWSMQAPGHPSVQKAQLALAAWRLDAVEVDRVASRAFRFDPASREEASRWLLRLGFPEVALKYGRPDGPLAVRLAFAAGRPEEARRWLRTLTPEDQDLERQAAESLMDAGRPLLALGWLTRRRVTPEPEFRVRALHRAGQTQAARTAVREVEDPSERAALQAWLQADPSAPPPWDSPRAEILFRRRTGQWDLDLWERWPGPDRAGRVERAVMASDLRHRDPNAVLSELRARDPDDPHLLWALGRLARRRGASDQAARYLGRAVRLDPGAWRAWSEWGLLQCDSDQAEAQQAFDAALEAFEAGWRSGRVWSRDPLKELEAHRRDCPTSRRNP